MTPCRLFTIGFTKKSAEAFFGKLRASGVRRVIDVRLNNASQLAGFAKRDDLRYFLKTICDINYLHLTDMSPTLEILDAFKKGGGDWNAYEKDFLSLMKGRKIEESLSREMLHNTCLLCSEAEPDYCHRRLVAQYLQEKLGDITIMHLL